VIAGVEVDPEVLTGYHEAGRLLSGIRPFTSVEIAVDESGSAT